MLTNSPPPIPLSLCLTSNSPVLLPYSRLATILPLPLPFFSIITCSLKSVWTSCSTHPLCRTCLSTSLSLFHNRYRSLYRSLHLHLSLYHTTLFLKPSLPMYQPRLFLSISPHFSIPLTSLSTLHLFLITFLCASFIFTRPVFLYLYSFDIFTSPLSTLHFFILLSLPQLSTSLHLSLFAFSSLTSFSSLPFSFSFLSVPNHSPSHFCLTISLSLALFTSPPHYKPHLSLSLSFTTYQFHLVLHLYFYLISIVSSLLST